MDPSHPLWASPVEAPLVIDDVEAHPWNDSADLVVAGLGGAGVAAALEAIERGVKVIAVGDRYGSIKNPQGIDIPALNRHVALGKLLKDFPAAEPTSHPCVLR